MFSSISKNIKVSLIITICLMQLAFYSLISVAQVVWKSDGTVIDAVRFVPRKAFEKVQGFDLKLTGPEDWDFDKKIRGLGKTIVAKANLEHDEGNFDLENYLSKKSYYSKSFENYSKKWGKDDPDIRKQLGIWYRFFGVFTEDGKIFKLLRHPILSISVYYLRIRVGIIYLLTNINKKMA